MVSISKVFQPLKLYQWTFCLKFLFCIQELYSYSIALICTHVQSNIPTDMSIMLGHNIYIYRFVLHDLYIQYNPTHTSWYKDLVLSFTNKRTLKYIYIYTYSHLSKCNTHWTFVLSKYETLKPFSGCKKFFSFVKNNLVFTFRDVFFSLQ